MTLSAPIFDRIRTAFAEFRRTYDRAHEEHAKALFDRFVRDVEIVGVVVGPVNDDADTSAEQDLRYIRADLDWVMDRAWAQLKEALHADQD